MKKTYWWRVILLISTLFIAVAFYYIPCEQIFGRCTGGNDMPIIRTSFHFLLATIVVSLFLFFANDNIFKKWSIFAITLIILSSILISMTPEYSGGWGPNYNLERESFSIWMAKAFVIISLVLIIWQSIKERRSKKI
jgi:hypothetical protein